jgi:uncharacterized protein YkwD
MPNPGVVPPAIATLEPSEVVERLLALHNDARARAKLPPLAPSPELEAAARRHARDMARRGRMSHRGSDGGSPFQRMAAEGYEFTRAGENVAAGDFTPESVVRGWMKSPPHRRNILGSFHDIGAAYATAVDGRSYWCVTFGTPLERTGPSRTSIVGYSLD